MQDKTLKINALKQHSESCRFAVSAVLNTNAIVIRRRRRTYWAGSDGV